MAARGSTDCTTWLKLVDEIRKTPLYEALRSTKFDHPLTAHNAPPELKHTPHLLFHELANQLAQKAQHFLAPYCGMSFLAISALFLLYIHIGKSLWFTWIPCNEASACRVSIIKQTNKQNHPNADFFFLADAFLDCACHEYKNTDEEKRAFWPAVYV